MKHRRLTDETDGTKTEKHKIDQKWSGNRGICEIRLELMLLSTYFAVRFSGGHLHVTFARIHIDRKKKIQMSFVASLPSLLPIRRKLQMRTAPRNRRRRRRRIKKKQKTKCKAGHNGIRMLVEFYKEASRMHFQSLLGTLKVHSKRMRK